MRSEDESVLTLTECEEMMIDLQEKYPIEYKAYGLSSVAVAIVFPLIKSFLDVSLFYPFLCPDPPPSPPCTERSESGIYTFFS